MCLEVAISERIHVRRQKHLQSAFESSNVSPDCYGQEPWASVVLWGKADVVTTGTFLEHVCLTVSCPGQNSRRPGLGCCRRSIGERRSWLFSLGVQQSRVVGCCPGSHHHGMFCCIPSWRVGSWSRQRTEWGVGTSEWPLVWIANMEICRLSWSCILQHLRTTTQSLIVLEIDRPVTIPTAHEQRWQGRGSCSGLTQVVQSWESLACLQLCNGSPVERWWKPCSYRLAAQWQRSCLQ